MLSALFMTLAVVCVVAFIPSMVISSIAEYYGSEKLENFFGMTGLWSWYSMAIFVALSLFFFLIESFAVTTLASGYLLCK